MNTARLSASNRASWIIFRRQTCCCCLRSRSRLDWRHWKRWLAKFRLSRHVGGLPEVVTDGETGYLSPVGDVDKMADAARLLADDKLRRQMGQRARESAISRYRTDVVIPQYIEFYEQIIATQPCNVFTDCWHSRSHRSRKERPRARSDGCRSGPSAGRETSWYYDRSRLADLELDDLRIGFVDAWSRTLHQKHVGRGAWHRLAGVGDRCRRRCDAADARALRHLSFAWRAQWSRRDHQEGSG